MNLRSVFLVVLAVVCGGSAAIGVSQFAKSDPIMIKPDTTPILVAKGDIARGRMVTADLLQTRDWPKEFVPANALTNVDEALDRAALTPILPGEPVLGPKLAPKDAGRGLAALIPKGMRAFTIQTSKVASNVAGFVLPGNRVDVLLSLRSRGAQAQDDGTGGGSTTTLLQAVEILAVDQQLDAPADNKMEVKSLQSVTLLVTPEQASLLDLGQNMGQLTLALRNPEDLLEADTVPATLADIRFRQEVPVVLPTEVAAAQPQSEEPEKKDPPPLEIRTLRGSHTSRVLVTLRG